MALEFISPLLSYVTANAVLLAVVLILLIIAMRRTKRVAFTAGIVIIASVAIPLALRFFAGLLLPFGINAIVLYVTVGLGAYFIFLIGTAVYSILGAAEKSVQKVSSPLGAYMKRRKTVDSRMKDFVRKQEKIEKEGRKQRHEKEHDEQRVQAIEKKVAKERKKDNENEYVELGSVMKKFKSDDE